MSDPVAAQSASASPAEACGAATKEPVDIAAAESGRVALIITNQDYPTDVGRLEATHKDGETVCRALVALGFSIRLVKDADLDTIQREIQGYKHRLSRLEGPGSDRASFFYFSGHGAAVDEGGANYLIPVAAEIRRRADLVVKGVNLDDLIKQVQLTADQFGIGSNFIVIDACRNPAFAAGSRSAVRGFSPVAEQSGIMIAFSTAPGKTAVDRNFYSEALARELQVPNRDAFLAFREVRRAVLRETKGHQFPWTHDGLINEFIFKADARAPQNVSQARSSSTESKSPRIEDGKPVLVDCDDCPRLRRLDPPPPAAGQAAVLRSFAIGMHEVTFDDWAACVRDRGCAGAMPSDAGFGRGRHPVINVNRTEIELYLDWLSRKSKQRYRLPTEAEWEYAARDGADAAVVNGADARTLCTFAHASLPNQADAPGCAERPARGTREVGRLRPNPAGLFDMAGNVAEWVETCFADRSAPKSAGDPCDRVVKGGSWRSGIQELTIGDRKRTPVGFSGRTVGFRIARDVD